MSDSTRKQNVIRFHDLMTKWDATHSTAHSRLRCAPKRAQRKIATTLSSLTDDAMMVAFTVFGTCSSCEEATENSALAYKGTIPKSQPMSHIWFDFMGRRGDEKYWVDQSRYIVALAPAWNVMRGNAGDPGYCMRQSVLKMREEVMSDSFELVAEDPRLLAKTIGLMMYNDSTRNSGMNWDDALWFGENWKDIAPLWNAIKSAGTFSKAHVELLIEAERSGLRTTFAGGLL